MSFVSSTRCTRRLASGSAPCAATQCGRSRPSFCERARPSALGLTPRRRGQAAGSLRDRPGRRQPPRQHMPQEELRARPCSCSQRHRGGSSPGPSHSSSSLRRSMPQQKWPQRLEGSRRHRCSSLRRSSSSTLHSMPQRERARSSWPKELWPRSLPHGRRPSPFGAFLRGGEPPPPAECRHAGVGAALAEEAESPPPLPRTPRRAARAVPSLVNELAAQPHGNPWAGQPHAPALAALPLPPAYQLPQSAVAESPPPLPTALQCRTAAEAAKQSPMPVSQLQWPTAGEASAPAAAASATGQRDKKNKQHRRVEADRPESPERPPRHVEDAVRPESPQRLQQVVHQLSDENLHLRRRICELEAELLLLRPQPQTTQRLERQDC